MLRGDMNINNFRYAEDTASLTFNKDDLQNLVTTVQYKGMLCEMDMNVKKNKSVLIIKKQRKLPKYMLQLKESHTNRCKNNISGKRRENRKCGIEIKRKIEIL